MKNILQVIVPIFFFLGIGYYVYTNSLIEESIIKLDTNTAEEVNVVTNSYSFNEKPDPTEINKRILKEDENTSFSEKKLTDSLIIDFLIQQDRYNHFVTLTSSKTVVKVDVISLSTIKVNVDSTNKFNEQNLRLSYIKNNSVSDYRKNILENK